MEEEIAEFFGSPLKRQRRLVHEEKRILKVAG
jgi:hypothetical protein